MGWTNFIKAVGKGTVRLTEGTGKSVGAVAKGVGEGMGATAKGLGGWKGVVGTGAVIGAVRSQDGLTGPVMCCSVRAVPIRSRSMEWLVKSWILPSAREANRQSVQQRIWPASIFQKCSSR